MLIGGGRILASMRGRSLVTLASLFTLLFVASVSHIYAFAQDANLTEQQQISELKSEVEELKTRVNNSGTDFLGGLFGQILTLIGASGAAAIGAVLTWQFQRRIPPTAEQEDVFNKLAKEWYDTSHLVAFHKIWNNIQKSPDQDRKIDYYWNRLMHKEFDRELLGEEYDMSRTRQMEYLRKRLYLDVKFVNARFQTIENSADVEYYDLVRQELPKLVEIALHSVLGKLKGELNHDNYQTVVYETIHELKRLMVFARIREDKGVIESVVRAKVYENMQSSTKK
jgi:hypothetical protein